MAKSTATTLEAVELNGQTVKVGDVMTSHGNWKGYGTTDGTRALTIVKITSNRITVRFDGDCRNNCWGHKYTTERADKAWENWTKK